jgi:hypothetical protein
MMQGGYRATACVKCRDMAGLADLLDTAQGAERVLNLATTDHGIWLPKQGCLVYAPSSAAH